MTSFTPFSAAAGGILIGLSVAMFALLNGRVAGISGILGGILRFRRDDMMWRIAFLFGLMATPAVYAAVMGSAPSLTVTSSSTLLIGGGLLVGFGTRLGGGCTSGHGVCGIARLSPRSLVATAVFMTAGAVTVAIGRHVMGG